MTFAAGLDGNPRCGDTKIHSYDRFIVDADYMVSFARDWMPKELTLGQSYERIFREVTADHAGRIVVHAGDLLEQKWKSGPIELLFVDAAKTQRLSGHIIREFFPALIPGQSVVVHQDFFSPETFWIAVQMDALMDYFSIVEERMDFTVAFRLDRQIPARVLEKVGSYPYSFDNEYAALQRFKKRLGSEGWPIPMLECRLFQARGKHQGTPPVFLPEQRADPVFAGNAKWLREYCGIEI